MRTKSLLLAGAALAISLVASQAAPVYSQNVVGYANVPMAGSATYLLTIPFQIGSSNGANEVWPLSGGNPTIPDFSTMLIWNGAGYNAYLSDSSSGSLWDDTDYNALPGAPVIPVGGAFFLIPSSAVTSTFAGSVAVPISGTKGTPLSGSVTYMMSCYVPYSGSVNAGTTAGGGPNLSNAGTGLPDFSTLLIWNGAGYAAYLSDSSSGSSWDDTDYNALVTAPTIGVAQGFFLIPSGNFTWTVGLAP